jgi:hypothetical protein
MNSGRKLTQDCYQINLLLSEIFRFHLKIIPKLKRGSTSSVTKIHKSLETIRRLPRVEVKEKDGMIIFPFSLSSYKTERLKSLYGVAESEGLLYLFRLVGDSRSFVLQSYLSYNMMIC